MTKPWDEHVFRKEFDKISPFTLVDHHRCYVLLQLLNQALHFTGDIAEVGVYKGGTAKLINNFMKTHRASWKLLHLFDTFEGMPEVDPTKDCHRKGDFNDTSLDAVAQLIGSWQTQFHQGLFPESAWEVKDQKFCFVHVDCDIYSSVKACCEFFYPKIEKGILVFDDYGSASCPGAKAAVDEFFSDPSRIEEPIRITTEQAIVFKA